ncbi:ADP-ribosylglycohydrolase family protein [Rhodococcus cercidiphylli]|uniref:ADP-ribosylglycohydrolase family protein n=1 Tax=Rhodococcus cercidiphylli TaxID=489916 RepID=A0ABU4B3Q6_9NOCA|nr:ADP-ribosylglycohydrolase family protein [Rhodococcus cercidiphylli]MDV6233129.1 ADP-ribosylglycohydrolase family protein [Rhodococcus cercidiphylli]
MQLTDIQHDRARGVLLGTAVGDALGAGYEFGYPSPETTIAMVGGGAFDWAPGEWTDDTSMALCVARALEQGGDIDDIAENFRAWFAQNPPDVGNQTRSVLAQTTLSGAEMTAAAASLSGRTGGNGSLMRTAPVALAYLDDAAGCRAAAARISALTHSDPHAGEACQLWTHAIRYAVLRGTYGGVREFLAEVDTDVREFWQPLLDQAQEGQPSDFPNNGWVVHALQTAWWAIHRSADSDRPLPAALELCVRAGGDTDTTAAIAGGLLGARWGASAVPREWRDIVRGYPGLRADDLDRITTNIIAAKEIS